MRCDQVKLYKKNLPFRLDSLNYVNYSRVVGFCYLKHVVTKPSIKIGKIPFDENSYKYSLQYFRRLISFRHLIASSFATISYAAKLRPIA